MKKNFYLFSSIFLLTTFLGFEKANSKNFDKAYIASVDYSRDLQSTNSFTTNVDINSHSTYLSYTGTNELDAYWYGVGIGIAETLCYSVLNGYISNNLARSIMSEYRNTFNKDKDFRSINFEEGVQLAPDSYPNCRL